MATVLSTPTKLRTRKIGNHEVSAMGWGAMNLSVGYGPAPPDEERYKLLDDICERGVNFWDTADCYGDNEVVIGEWFKRTGKRDDVFLATKFGLFSTPDRFVNGTPEYVRQAVEKSLKRLGIETIDLLYYHRPDPTVPIEKTVTAMAEFVKEGKVRYLGLSECSADTLRRAHAVHPITAIEVEYSALVQDIEDPKIGLLQAANELGVTVVAYSPLGRGVLTGQIKGPEDFSSEDFRLMIGRLSKENFPNILKVVDALKRVGDRQGATTAQAALAWVLAQGDNIIPIPGSTKIKRVEENIGALKVKITEEEVCEVRELAANTTHGDRYPGYLMDVQFGDTPSV
ncbi:Aldo/keto reductase [Irpex rosettiformis]|uniref:Aldo/keto reductase n=1 Tax=Irpex rosettiformis TaxID=378272 RepID=A0ACB8UE07_9APHY|nr:Aldo/keto reductase [Irpex rosettiformis]